MRNNVSDLIEGQSLSDGVKKWVSTVYSLEQAPDIYTGKELQNERIGRYGINQKKIGVSALIST